MSSWAHQQGKGYTSSSNSLPCPKAELLASQSRRDKQQPRVVLFFQASRWSALPSSDALEGGILRREAAGNAAPTDAGEEGVLSPGLHHTAALQRFKGEPSGCSQDHPLPPHTHREKHHFWRVMGLVHGPESWFGLLFSFTSLHSIEVIY